MVGIPQKPKPQRLVALEQQFNNLVRWYRDGIYSFGCVEMGRSLEEAATWFVGIGASADWRARRCDRAVSTGTYPLIFSSRPFIEYYRPGSRTFEVVLVEGERLILLYTGEWTFDYGDAQFLFICG